MTVDQLLKLADFYYTVLVRQGASPRRFPDEKKYSSQMTPEQRLNHMAWVCDYVKELATKHGPEGVLSAALYLGWVQGKLHDADVYTVEEERAHAINEFPKENGED